MFFILGNFLPFYPPNNPKNEPSKKERKRLGDIIILHKCSKNYDYMLYCSWDMMCDQCNCFFFQCIFHLGPFSALFPPNSIKWKKHLVISSFHTSLAKTMIICYTVPEIWRMTHVIVIFHFALFFFTQIKKENETNFWKYHFTHVYHKLWLDDVRFLRYGARRTDRETDRWMDWKSDI